MHEEPERQGRRLTQEDILLEGERTPGLVESIICPVCLQVLPMPHYSCEGCDNAFCPECIESWWAKQPGTCVFKCEKATFKTVKRSNTYNALMDLLRAKCYYCRAPFSLAALPSHDRVCVRKPVECGNPDCPERPPKEELVAHLQHCQFKVVTCRFCSLKVKARELREHQQQLCEVREDICSLAGCGLSFKISEMENHRNNCPYRIVACNWCQTKRTAKQSEFHNETCEKRLFSCKWCNQQFSKDRINNHEFSCDQRKQLCQMCEKETKVATSFQHRQQCMWNSMLQMKKNQQILLEENLKLKKHVHELEMELQETQRNKQENTYEALLRVKAEERRDIERDLERLNNGIQNIQKLRKAEMDEHLKKPHFSSSLCPFCNLIRSKLEDQTAPLLRQRKEAETKLYELNRIEQGISNAARKSMIRAPKT